MSEDPLINLLFTFILRILISGDSIKKQNFGSDLPRRQGKRHAEILGLPRKSTSKNFTTIKIGMLARTKIGRKAKTFLAEAVERWVNETSDNSSESTIVTFNLKGFPESETKKYNIVAQHLDDFISQFLDIASGIVCGAIKRLRNTLKSPGN